MSQWCVAHWDNVTYSNSTTTEIKANAVYGTGQDAVVCGYEDKPWQPAECYVLRDPYNTIASRLAISDKMARASHGWKPDTLDLWLRFARLPVVFTYYNRFVRDAEYRLAEAHRLELPNPTRAPSIEAVGPWGGGSSFDGTRLLGSQLQVEDRWQRYAADPRFAPLLDPTVASLAQQHFGWHLNPAGTRCTTC